MSTDYFANLNAELTDDTRMPFGQTHRGKRLGDVPGKYWSWLLAPEQAWFQSGWPRLAAYARKRLNIDENGKPLPRVNHQKHERHER